MAEWQYNNKIPVNRGYMQDFPNARRARATEGNQTGYLEDPDGNVVHLWITEIQASFSQGGQFAQSARKRDWHGRNFVQPSFTITGQTASQQESARLAEFIRKCQQKSLRWESLDKMRNATKLVIRSGGDHHKKREPYVLYGHILKADRAARRWENAPDFQFDFLISYSYQGLFKQGKDTTIRKLSKWMDVFREKGTFIEDPDSSLYFDRNAPSAPGTSTAGGSTDRPT
jgi:hypothetical protein